MQKPAQLLLLLLVVGIKGGGHPAALGDTLRGGGAPQKLPTSQRGACLLEAALAAPQPMGGREQPTSQSKGCQAGSGHTSSVTLAVSGMHKFQMSESGLLCPAPSSGQASKRARCLPGGQLSRKRPIIRGAVPQALLLHCFLERPFHRPWPSKLSHKCQARQPRQSWQAASAAAPKSGRRQRGRLSHSQPVGILPG